MDVQTYFDATFPEWEEVYRRRTVYSIIYQERLSAALRSVDALRLPPRSTAVDIGCGPGFGTVGLARRGFRVHAVDTSSRMVELTLARAHRQGVGAAVEGSLSDIRALRLRASRFDLALVVGVSEWMETLAQPLDEVRRILKPGGTLVLTADNSWALSSLLEPLQNPLVVPVKRALGGVLRRLWPGWRPLRVYPRSRVALTEALSRAGLELRSSATLGFGPFTILNQRIVPEFVGQALHRRLQTLAEGSSGWLHDAGLVHVLVARKVTRASAPR
jgi:SAM-dependent methyltransferase